MTDPTVPPSPGAPVRGHAFLARVDNLLARLDGWTARVLPADSDPLGQAGRMANLSVLVAVISGVLLLLVYSSSLHQAYASIEVLRGHTLGGWMRAVHRYSSDLIMVFLIVHALRMIFARKFTGARWLPWVSGVAMVATVWFIGWTGFWLVWDQPAQKIAATSMSFLDALPIFGEPLSRLFLADRLVPSLLFFVVFFLHMLLPLLIALGLVIHVLRLNRVQLLPGRRLLVAFVLALAVASWIVPAPLDDPARMAEKSTHLTVDAWYLTPLALALRFQDSGLWLAIGGVGLLGAAVPWLLGRRFSPRAPAEGVRPSADFQTVVETKRCHACTQCVQDCPFDAVHMVPRTDGKRFAHQAWVDPTRCVGCAVCVGSCDSEAMHLPWYDAMRVEPDIQAAAAAAALKKGKPVRVALVAADIVGGMDLFDQAEWQARLPEYEVHAVPTAAWVRPKFVERLLAAEVEQVLIVRDARAEAAARDGNRWPLERMAGRRPPSFRPSRAGERAQNWRVVDFDPSAPDRLLVDAGQAAPAADMPRGGGWTPLRIGALLVGLAAIMTVTIAPSHLRVTNPESLEPEFVFSFKALGQREAAPVASTRDESNIPIHMRGRPMGKPNRLPVRVRLTIDGASEERTYAAKGISNDGPAIDVWRRILPPGAHDVTVEVYGEGSSGPQRWQGRIDARPRHLHVLTYDPTDGFRLE